MKVGLSIDFFVPRSCETRSEHPACQGVPSSAVGSLALPAASEMVYQRLGVVRSISCRHLLAGCVCGTLNLFLQLILPSAILRTLFGGRVLIDRLGSWISKPLSDCDVQCL